MVEQSKYDRLLQTNSEDSPDKAESENNGDVDVSTDDVGSSAVDTVEDASKQDVVTDPKSDESEKHDDKPADKDNAENISEENSIQGGKESEECSCGGGGEKRGNSKTDIFTDTGKVQKKTKDKKERKKFLKKKSKIGSRWIYLNSK